MTTPASAHGLVRVPVEVPGAEHHVHVGPGARHRVGAITAAVTRARTALVVAQEPVARHWLDHLLASLAGAGLATAIEVVADGEQAKDVATLARLWDACARAGLERRDVVVALGGGVVGDLAGFAAATFNRGINLVQVPTTLLAQVDASIGGKTGIDLPAGKNLVGAIHQPVAVVTDPEVLATVPGRILREGFGEVVKHALLADPDLFSELEAAGSAVLDDHAGRAELVRRNVAIKAAVVSEDAYEHGRRAHLNLGHTYAHALEALTGYAGWLHGEAVAVGTLVALSLGEELGLHGPELRTRTRDLLVALGLPVTAPVLDREQVAAVMARDKKADDGIRYVVLDDLGAPRLVRPSRAQVDAAIDRVEDPATPGPATMPANPAPGTTPPTGDTGPAPRAPNDRARTTSSRHPREAP